MKAESLMVSRPSCRVTLTSLVVEAKAPEPIEEHEAGISMAEMEVP